MFSSRTVPLITWVVGLGLLLAGPLYAQGAPRSSVSVAAAKAAKSSDKGDPTVILGTLILDVSPRTRVTTIGEFEDGLFRLGLWHHDVPIAPQVVSSRLPVIVTFNTVPLGGSGVRLDLRLSPEVKAVAVVRSTSDTVELHFSSHTFAGAKVRFMARKGLAQADADSQQNTDTRLAEILAMQLVDPPGWLEWGPMTWPMGLESPLRPHLALRPEPHPFGRIPKTVRRGWNDSPILARSVELANQGRIIEASRAVSGLPLATDEARALLALARGYIWSQPDGDGEPITPGRAAQAYSLAAGLQPDATWAPWARGQAAYNFGRAMKFHNAIYNYEKAIALAPTDKSRSLWEVGAGLAMVEAGREQEGVARLVRNLGGLPSYSDGIRFTGRRAVAHVLWTEGEVSRAARILDLLLEESPALAKNPRHDERWGRLLLDADRPVLAYPYFERIARNSVIKVERERARWWLHESGLAQKDSVIARRWLRELLQNTPASTLGPLAKLRLRVLDSVESGGERMPGLRYQEVVLALRNQALEWGDTPVQDEALSFAGQLFFELDMLEDGLHLYRWVNERTPSEGGAIAYSKIICEWAPLAFDDLRVRGHTLRAVGVFRVFLDTPAGRTCVDSDMRAAAAATAETAGLPTLAIRWLGQAVATGGSTADDGLNLIELARLYLREDNLKSAEKTLRYIEATNTLIPAGLVDEVWGDIHLENKRFKKAEVAYARALEGVAKSARHRNRDARLRFQHGLAVRALGRHSEAVVALRQGIEGGGAPRGPQGWLRLLESTLIVASSPADYEKALEICAKSDQGELNETSHRAVNWHRSQALAMLGRTEEADQILQNLSGGTDAWAVMAVEAQLDRRFNKEIDRLLSLPSPLQFGVEPTTTSSAN
jgi:tetratricopeptide (TPR) repeat protein